MGPGRNTVLGAVALTVTLGLAAFVAVVTTGEEAAPVAAGPNHAPTWDAPADGSRFDVEPGRSTSFVVAAQDPDGDVVRVHTRFTDAGGVEIPRPAHVVCLPDTKAGPSARMGCRIAGETASIAFMEVRVTDGRGGTAPARRYLVSVSPLTYVALGDSYAAGEGVEPFFRDGAGPDGANRCHRSAWAYPTSVRFAGDTGSVYEQSSPAAGDDAKRGSDRNVRRDGTRAWSTWACSGASTDDVLTERAGDDRRPELDNPDIGPGVDLVTISIGGNDVGFAQALNRCGAPPFRDQDCLAGTIDGAPFMTGIRARFVALRPKLVAVYRAILERTYGARLLVVGYPQVVPASRAEQRCLALRAFDFTPEEQDALRTLGRELDETIRSAAEEAGATYVDLASTFAGHEVCGRAGEWINGVSSTLARWPPVDDESFHPKRAGHAAMAAAVNAAVAG